MWKQGIQILRVTVIETAAGFSQGMERAAQGGGRDAIPTGVSKICRSGTEWHGHAGDGLAFGLNDLGGLFQPYYIYDSLVTVSSSPENVWVLGSREKRQRAGLTWRKWKKGSEEVYLMTWKDYFWGVRLWDQTQAQDLLWLLMASIRMFSIMGSTVKTRDFFSWLKTEEYHSLGKC